MLGSWLHRTRNLPLKRISEVPHWLEIDRDSGWGDFKGFLRSSSNPCLYAGLQVAAFIPSSGKARCSHTNDMLNLGQSPSGSKQLQEYWASGLQHNNVCIVFSSSVRLEEKGSSHPLEEKMKARPRSVTTKDWRRGNWRGEMALNWIKETKTNHVGEGRF